MQFISDSYTGDKIKWQIIRGLCLGKFFILQKTNLSIQGTASGTSVSKYGTIMYFIYLFLVQLATISTAEIIGHQKAGWLMNN